jgi:hypothetical protein
MEESTTSIEAKDKSEKKETKNLNNVEVNDV